MNTTAIAFDYGVDELQQAGLTLFPSTLVAPPRIAESPLAMECELIQIIELGANAWLVLGRVLAMHVRDASVLDAARGHVDTPKLKLVGRMHGADWYARTSDLSRCRESLSRSGEKCKARTARLRVAGRTAPYSSADIERDLVACAIVELRRARRLVSRDLSCVLGRAAFF